LKNARTVRYFAEALMFCVQNNLDLSAADLIPYVKKQATSEFREIIGSMDDDGFENFLGKDQISRLRKRNLQRLKAGNPNAIKNTAAANASKKEPEPAKKENLKDFLGKLGKF